MKLLHVIREVAQPWARFRRWCHLMRHLFTWTGPGIPGWQPHRAISAWYVLDLDEDCSRYVIACTCARTWTRARHTSSWFRRIIPLDDPPIPPGSTIKSATLTGTAPPPKNLWAALWEYRRAARKRKP